MIIVITAKDKKEEGLTVTRHSEKTRYRAGRSGILVALFLATLGLGIFNVASASAAKQIVDYFGSPPGKNEFGQGTLGGEFNIPKGVAVNNSGAGPANQGDIYVVDSFNNRIQRFGHGNNGTPTDIYDDSYPFLGAWGLGVQAGDEGYAVCTVAANCQAGTASGVGGALSGPENIAIDQDTGALYVADTLNYRIDVYDGVGTFLRAFGWDVVESGPGNTGLGYEVCVPADGDHCKSGLPGSGLGQVGPRNFNEGRGIAVSPPDGNAATGTVYFADPGNTNYLSPDFDSNHRLNTYELDGSSPGSVGSSSTFLLGPEAIGVDSRGVVYASNRTCAELARYDSENANGGGSDFLTPLAGAKNESQVLIIHATAGQYKLTFDPDGSGPQAPETTGNLNWNADGTSDVESALAALPSIGAGNVSAASFNSGGAENGRYIAVGFTGALALTDVSQLVVTNGTTPLTGAIDAKTVCNGHDGPLYSSSHAGVLQAIAVELDSDGPGPDSDVLYAIGGSGVQQFGPANPPGLSAPPNAADDLHGDSLEVAAPRALAIDESNGSIYVIGNGGGAQKGAEGVYVLNTTTATAPTASLDSLSDIGSTEATVHATVNPNGPPDVGYRLEYSTDGTNWESTPEVAIGRQEAPQSIEAPLDPPTGLLPNTLYHVRLVALKRFFPAVITAEKTFTTLPAQPLVETTGSPVRTATTARLDSRVAPQNSPTTFYFEYGAQGPCDANPCVATEAQDAGSGATFALVSAQLSGLAPGTTYHYRVIAENGAPEGPAFGEDMTLTTFADDAPLSHGHLPGPPGSDRAWEQVSAPELGGNPVSGAPAISDQGDRAIYGVKGGTPLSETGTLGTQLFAERTPTGWQTKRVYPSRGLAQENFWLIGGGPSDLSSFVAANYPSTLAGEFSLWRMNASGSQAKLYGTGAPSWKGFLAVSDDSSRVLVGLTGSLDPEHPAAPGTVNLYDVGSGAARMVDLLPDGSVPACGMEAGPEAASRLIRPMRWLTPDGSHLFFSSSGNSCSGASPLYVRDLEAEETKLIGTGDFLKSTPGAVFLISTVSLASDDGGGNDVYRYDLSSEALKCVTCVLPGVDAEVLGNQLNQIGVAEDGSRVYFASNRRLLPGAAHNGGTYRVDIAGGELAYVGTDLGGGLGIGDADEATLARAMTPDGSVVLFRSSAPSLNALGGQQNAGTEQYYRYDDRDRSLVCISCPPDGSAPRGDVYVAGALGSAGLGPNTRPLDASGDTAVFDTPTALVSADQNTARAGQSRLAGTDVYEWRDGRLLLISDGLTNWPVSSESESVPLLANGQMPEVSGITPSGHDVFFTEAAQLTPDALDGYRRLYDARVGGGFEFQRPPKPCPLEVCQGTPKGAPEEPLPGTAFLQGPGNPGSEPPKCPKRRVRRHGKCIAKHRKSHHKRRRAAGHTRRSAR